MAGEPHFITDIKEMLENFGLEGVHTTLCVLYHAKPAALESTGQIRSHGLFTRELQEAIGPTLKIMEAVQRALPGHTAEPPWPLEIYVPEADCIVPDDHAGTLKDIRRTKNALMKLKVKHLVELEHHPLLLRDLKCMLAEVIPLLGKLETECNSLTAALEKECLRRCFYWCKHPINSSSASPQRQCRLEIKRRRPFFVMNSPPCTMYTCLQNANKAKMIKNQRQDSHSSAVESNDTGRLQ